MANFSGTWQNLGDIAEDRCCDMYWTARQCSRINWDYFGLNAVSVLLVLNIIERLLNDIGKDRYYYIGLTQDPLFRMHKISRKNGSISAHYPLKWSTMSVIAFGPTAAIANLEKCVILKYQVGSTYRDNCLGLGCLAFDHARAFAKDDLRCLDKNNWKQNNWKRIFCNIYIFLITYMLN